MKCDTKYCRNNRAPRHKHCHKCIQRKWRKNNPLKYCFNTLKCNAKRRGKVFELTFVEFKSFVFETDYMELKGRTRYSLSIDRIDNHLGYTATNIRAITLSANTARENYRRYGRHDSDVPF